MHKCSRTQDFSLNRNTTIAVLDIIINNYKITLGCIEVKFGKELWSDIFVFLDDFLSIKCIKSFWIFRHDIWYWVVNLVQTAWGHLFPCSSFQSWMLSQLQSPIPFSALQSGGALMDLLVLYMSFIGFSFRLSHVWNPFHHKQNNSANPCLLKLCLLAILVDINLLRQPHCGDEERFGKIQRLLLQFWMLQNLHICTGCVLRVYLLPNILSAIPVSREPSSRSSFGCIVLCFYLVARVVTR